MILPEVFMNDLHILKEKVNVKRLLIITGYGVFIGGLVGVLISLYRKIVTLLQGKMIGFYAGARGSVLNFILVLFVIGLLAFIVGKLTQKEPKIGGSGIPQVSGQLKGIMDVKWKPVLLFKFVGGLIGLGSGLTVGREGPSVQMGATLGQAVADSLQKDENDKRLFITAGAAAGLSAAFNAPLSGLVFVLEELHQKFDKYIFLIAAASAYLADYVSGVFFGASPVINVGRLVDIPLEKYHFIILLALIVGFLAQYFIKGIYYVKKLYEKLKLPLYAKVMIPFLVTAIVVIFVPDLFGSGEHFIFLPLEGNIGIDRQIFLLFTKFLLLLLAFCSGMPGGIFLPMLVLGSLIGNIFASAMVSMGIFGQEYILIFSLIAMAANFSAIVRSPITAMLLIIEMTGAFTYFLPLGLGVMISYLLIESLKIKPVYEVLLEMMLEKK